MAQAPCYNTSRQCLAGQSGYNMGSIKEVLLTARSRFHDLLIPAAVQLATRAIAEDDYQQASVSAMADVSCCPAAVDDDTIARLCCF